MNENKEPETIKELIEAHTKLMLDLAAAVSKVAGETADAHAKVVESAQALGKFISDSQYVSLARREEIKRRMNEANITIGDKNF